MHTFFLWRYIYVHLLTSNHIYMVVVDDLASTALTVDCFVCVCLLQEWGLLGCGSWALVCSGWCAGVDTRHMDKVCCVTRRSHHVSNWKVVRYMYAGCRVYWEEPCSFTWSLWSTEWHLPQMHTCHKCTLATNADLHYHEFNRYCL